MSFTCSFIHQQSLAAATIFATTSPMSTAAAATVAMHLRAVAAEAAAHERQARGATSALATFTVDAAITKATQEREEAWDRTRMKRRLGGS